ncbi:GLPGLI family protein [Flammeovirga kamogawensis]|uniref:GLPGLI family protein n=1 Tax=Flammeovirga kamogawensis TaxID=373891 RepID=A0ABX8H508_9BACT|nr:GLPGLI family protein [Flammeovirga kamogawensis]MBB6461751.1 GLPGLI family protein [Flammeovirga kamogawensis]QWG10667.1 GLPGLI family protein [Flammeovirga kamogawensis]TRX63770.1 GLPGLI family protein [Flammeovirga kamogawensis]
MRAFVIISLFLLQTQLLFSQQRKIVLDSAEIECYYDLNFKESTLDSNYKESVFVLLIGKNQISKFTEHANEIRDSALDTFGIITKEQGMQGALNFLASLPRSKFKYSIFKSNGDLEFNDRLFGVNYIYHEKVENAMQWELHSDKKIIANYRCQKATVNYAGRDYEAWFTMDVPISEGPYKFTGLPGLVIEVYDTNRDYHFMLTYLQKYEHYKPITKPRISASEVTHQKFLKIRDKAFKNIRISIQNSPVGASITEDVLMRYEKKMARKDNPMEIYNEKAN